MSLPLAWRTLLFVPANSDRFLQSAIRHRPDAVILDLEDSISQADKTDARRALSDAQAALARTGIDCVVRVNAPLAAMVDDIKAIDDRHLSALLLPKIECVRPIENAHELLPDVAKIALIETPSGVAELFEIAESHVLDGIMLGSEDLSASLGVNPDNGALDWPTAQIGIAASRRGLLAIGFPGSIGNFRDLDLYRKQLDRARNLGMNAVAAVHPAQLPVIREMLMPTDAEIAWARSVVEAAGRTQNAVLALNNTMIDPPVIARANRILTRSAVEAG